MDKEVLKKEVSDKIQLEKKIEEKDE